MFRGRAELLLFVQWCIHTPGWKNAVGHGRLASDRLCNEDIWGVSVLHYLVHVLGIAGMRSVCMIVHYIESGSCRHMSSI